MFKVKFRLIVVKCIRLKWEECGPRLVFACYAMTFTVQVRKESTKKKRTSVRIDHWECRKASFIRRPLFSVWLFGGD